MGYKKILFGFGILNSILLFFLICCFLDNQSFTQSYHANLSSSLHHKNFFTSPSENIDYSAFSNENNVRTRNIILLLISGLSVLPFVLFSSIVVKKFNKYRRRQNELINVNKNKDLFFSIISHDLKSPAQNLIALSELAKNQMDFKPEENVKINDIIHISAKKHYDLLCNLLDWSKAQFTGDHQIKTMCNLSELINENIISQIDAAKEKHIEITNHVGNNISLSTNENMLNSVIRNLLNNAIKFTPKNGKIFFYCKVHKNFIELFIEDNGVGMSNKTLKNLFDLKYIRSLRGTNKEIGTGVGLILCKEILMKLHGKIKVISHENAGSTFIIHLPL